MAEPDPVPEVSDAMLAVLQSLWDHGPSTIRQLTDRLYPDGSASSYATVQKLLERLEERNCVTRDRGVTPHVFAAVFSREAFIGGRLRAMADRLCGGSLTPLLTHLVATETLSAKDRQELRRLLDRPERGK
jgi:predicted transcriptional regulator